MEKGISCR